MIWTTPKNCLEVTRTTYHVNFAVPGAPVGKARPRVTRQGHAYTPQKTKDYENLVRQCYLSQIGEIKFVGKKPLEVLIEAEFPLPKSTPKKKIGIMDETYHTRKPDGDNLAKSILDALNGIAFEDDSAVSVLTVVKTWTAGDPVVYVHIQEIPTIKRITNYMRLLFYHGA